MHMPGLTTAPAEAPVYIEALKTIAMFVARRSSSRRVPKSLSSVTPSRTRAGIELDIVSYN
jgi:hypothetical protein